MLQQKITITLSDRDTARRIASALSDLIEPGPDALTIFEEPQLAATAKADGTFSTVGSLWRVDAYYADMPDAAALAAAGYLRHGVFLHSHIHAGSDLDRATCFEDRAALGLLVGVLETRGLDQAVAA